MPWEGHSLAIRADMFNAFNKVQWGFPNTTYSLDAFGTPNPALGTLNTVALGYAPRSIQLSIRYSF